MPKRPINKMSRDERENEIKSLGEELLGPLRTLLPKAIRYGELLTEQKADMKHEEWGKWVDANLPFSRTTATDYMHVFNYRDDPKLQETCNLTDAISAARKCKTDERRNDPDDSKDTVEPLPDNETQAKTKSLPYKFSGKRLKTISENVEWLVAEKTFKAQSAEDVIFQCVKKVREEYDAK